MHRRQSRSLTPASEISVVSGASRDLRWSQISIVHGSRCDNRAASSGRSASTQCHLWSYHQTDIPRISSGPPDQVQTFRSHQQLPCVDAVFPRLRQLSSSGLRGLCIVPICVISCIFPIDVIPTGWHLRIDLLSCNPIRRDQCRSTTSRICPTAPLLSLGMWDAKRPSAYAASKYLMIYATFGLCRKALH
jgi:hypothetical protein